MSFSAIGGVFDAQTFKEHLDSLPSLRWAKGVTIHHTAYPDLSMRPKGWTLQHMRNLADYYGIRNGWSAGPHLFTDEDQIWGLSPLTERGVHAVSFNANYIGIEALGNYDIEDPHTGRGQQVWRMTAVATALLLIKLGLPADSSTIKFHRDDPKTSKSCPGKNVGKGGFITTVATLMVGAQSDPVPTTDDTTNDQGVKIAKALDLLDQAIRLLKH